MKRNRKTFVKVFKRLSWFLLISGLGLILACRSWSQIRVPGLGRDTVTDEDVVVCYDMSLKEFEHFAVHDLFKAMSKFMVASRQATKMDQERIRLEVRIHEVQAGKAEVAAKAMDEVKDFRASSEFTDLLDKNYVVGFEDFHMDTVERYPEVDFNSIKLNIGAASSLLQTSFEDVNIEDDATIQLV